MNEIVREYGAGLFELAAEENCADELLTEEREIKNCSPANTSISS